jgi:ribosomal protein L11 methyltransferase
LASVTYPALDLRFAPGPGAGTFQDMLYAELDAFEPVAIQEHDTGDGWRVFFRTAALRDAACGTLASEFGNALLELVPQDVEDEDWARRSQAALQAVRVGRIVIAPPWEASLSGDSRLATGNRPRAARESRLATRDSRSREATGSDEASDTSPDLRLFPSHQPPAASRDILIIIDPSMGFGTGHHPTTRLCLELLQRIDVHGKRVIDVGTGSGVLALAAWALGASSVSALDYDADALQNARDNIQRNGAAEAIEIVEGDLRSVVLQPADIVVANLTAAGLKRHVSVLQRLLADAGLLIVSGFSGEEVEEITGAFRAKPAEVMREGEWTAILMRL